MKEARVHASKILKGPASERQDARSNAFIEAWRHALYASKICSYAQGFVQLQAAAKEHDWPLNTATIAFLWRGGCIIRAAFLERIKEAFDADATSKTWLLHPYFTEALTKSPGRLARARRPCPAHRPARRRVPAHWPLRTPIAANDCRPTCSKPNADYFGAHTYQRIDARSTKNSTASGSNFAVNLTLMMPRRRGEREMLRSFTFPRASAPPRDKLTPSNVISSDFLHQLFGLYDQVAVVIAARVFWAERCARELLRPARASSSGPQEGARPTSGQGHRRARR